MTIVKRILLVAVAALTIASPARAELVGEEKAFIEAFMGAAIIADKCSGYELDTDGMIKSGDMVGVDGRRLALASLAAIMVAKGMEYDRSHLIPEVTRFVRATVLSLPNRKNPCADADRAIAIGFLERK